jgi:RNA polymerase sigma-70 factor (ECF subfamily)
MSVEGIPKRKPYWSRKSIERARRCGRLVPTSPESDEAIVLRAAKDPNGDVAVGEILARYCQDPKYLFMAIDILHSKEDSEDAVSDALVLALRKWRQFRGAAKFSTWYARIVITCALMIRRGKREHSPDVPDVPFPQELDEAIYRKEIRLLLREAIGGLDSARERKILKLRVESDLPFSQISQRLGIPLGTVKTVAIGAYTKLKKMLAEEAGAAGVPVSDDAASK